MVVRVPKSSGLRPHYEVDLVVGPKGTRPKGPDQRDQTKGTRPKGPDQMAPKKPVKVKLLPTYWSDENISEYSTKDYRKYGNSIFDAAAIGIQWTKIKNFHLHRKKLKLGLSKPYLHPTLLFT